MIVVQHCWVLFSFTGRLTLNEKGIEKKADKIVMKAHWLVSLNSVCVSVLICEGNCKVTIMLHPDLTGVCVLHGQVSACSHILLSSTFMALGDDTQLSVCGLEC